MTTTSRSELFRPRAALTSTPPSPALVESLLPMQIVGSGLLAMIVCCPASSTDADVLAFAEQVDPAGTSGGWQITPNPESIPAAEGGCSYRAACAERTGCVHIRINVRCPMESPSEHDDSLRARGWRQVYEVHMPGYALLHAEPDPKWEPAWEPAPGVAGVPRVVETRFEGGSFYLLTVRWVQRVGVSDE